MKATCYLLISLLKYYTVIINYFYFYYYIIANFVILFYIIFMIQYPYDFIKWNYANDTTFTNYFFFIKLEIMLMIL